MFILKYFPILLFCNLLFSPVLATSSSEPVNPELAKKYITDILRQPEFQTTREEHHWQRIDKSVDEQIVTEEVPEDFLPLSSLIAILANALEILLWTLLGLAILFLLRRAPHWLEKFSFQTKDQPIHVVQPRILGESLKDNPFAKSSSLSRQAWAIWQAGQPRAAISLLYRGALAILISRDKLAILDSTTESECVRLVERHQPAQLFNYFSELTRHWQSVAYAQRFPSDMEAQQLCKDWAQYFEV